jgi:long-chain fatty acid transport protein
MINRFYFRKLFILMATSGFLVTSQQAMAAAFQLWEQDAASIGNYHAGTAATADDASTAWYNPAGLIRIKNQEIIAGADPVLTNFRYSGSVNVNTLIDPLQPATAQGGTFNLIPFGHYAAPISDRVAFGFDVVVPYGLRTNYGTTSLVRYASTYTSLQVIDVTPSLAVAVTDKFSVGAGIDWQKANAEFDQTATAIDQTFDTFSKNTGHSYAWGYHAGVLYQFNPQTRAGLDYVGKVTHHLRGKSTFSGALANSATGGVQESDILRANITLPARTTVSILRAVNPCWDAMGSITYTQWNVISDITLQNTAGILGGVADNNLPIVVHQNLHNAWNFAVGANYHPNETWIFRTGAGYDQSPVPNRYRNLQLPDSDRIALALGAHYQATKALGFDGGWTHVFAMNTRINNLSQTVGDETVVTNGSVNASADVFGLQVKWDIA